MPTDGVAKWSRYKLVKYRMKNLRFATHDIARPSGGAGRD